MVYIYSLDHDNVPDYIEYSIYEQTTNGFRNLKYVVLPANNEQRDISCAVAVANALKKTRISTVMRNTDDKNSFMFLVY